MMLRRLLVAGALCAVFTTACGAFDFGKTEEALTPVTYTIGNPATVINTLSVPVQYMRKVAYFPKKPVGAETSASGFSDKWYVDNGGTAVGPAGDLNRVTFWVYRVNNGGNDYYVAQVDIIYTDGAGHVFYRPQVVVVTGWPDNHVWMTWAGGNVHLTMYDASGNPVVDPLPYAFVFPSGVMPTQVHSPVVQVSMDTSGAYGGCMREVPDYDDATNDTVNYKIDDDFGATQPSFPAYVAAPTSIAKCSMKISNHDTTDGWDVFQLHVDGF